MDKRATCLNCVVLIFIFFFFLPKEGFSANDFQKAMGNSDNADSRSDWQGIPAGWRVCAVDSDCTAGVENCLYWKAINKKYAKDLSKTLDDCLASIDPGFQPVTVCVNKVCQTTGRTTNVSWEDWLKEMQKLEVK